MDSVPPPAARGALFRAFASVLKSYATGPDGQSYAPGRLFAFAAFGVGQCLVIRATASLLAHAPSVAEWCAFFQGVGLFELTLASGCVGLIMGIAPTDPGGRWWDRGASPPPPPNVTGAGAPRGPGA